MIQNHRKKQIPSYAYDPVLNGKRTLNLKQSTVTNTSPAHQPRLSSLRPGKPSASLTPGLLSGIFPLVQLVPSGPGLLLGAWRLGGRPAGISHCIAPLQLPLRLKGIS